MNLTCSRCKAIKDETEFGFYPKNTRRNGRTSYCRPCLVQKSIESRRRHPETTAAYMAGRGREIRNKSSREFRERNPEKVKRWKERSRQIERARRLGMTVVQLQMAYDAQNARCAICKREIEYRSAHTDHCHDRNVFRGFLCSDCNHILGFAKDSIDILKAAISYLDRHKA